jgi:hypothetical protein
LVSIGTVNPELAPERDRFFSDTNAYSLVPPPGWEHNYFQVSNGDTDGWYPPEETPDKTNLGVILLSSKFDLEALKNMWQDNFSQIGVEIESIREDQLTGDTGQTYLRWELSQMAQDGVSYHMTYSFYNSENWSLVLIYMRPDDRGSEYDRIVDETMKTVRLNDSVRP